MKPLGGVMFVLALVSTAQAQASVGGSIGGYYRGLGPHPSVYFSGTLRAELGPIGLEFVHSPVLDGDLGALDLFAYRLTYRQDLLSGDVRPFLIAGAGYGWWRQWTCLEGTCAPGVGGDPPGRFERHRGLTVTAGGGTKLRTPGPLWSRADLRAEWTELGGVDLVGLVGFEVEF